jgi:hypothetical protein
MVLKTDSVLSKVFRGKPLELFDRTLADRSAGIGPSLGRPLLRQAAAKAWVVYSKAPMAGPAQVLRYLGRYTHRIAIGNERLVSLQDGHVTFRYRDRRRGNTKKVLTLHARGFIQRFLLHVLPRGFVRVRHFGFQANGCRPNRRSSCVQSRRHSLTPTRIATLTEVVSPSSTPGPVIAVALSTTLLPRSPSPLRASGVQSTYAVEPAV